MQAVTFEAHGGRAVVQDVRCDVFGGGRVHLVSPPPVLPPNAGGGGDTIGESGDETSPRIRGEDQGGGEIHSFGGRLPWHVRWKPVRPPGPVDIGPQNALQRVPSGKHSQPREAPSPGAQLAGSGRQK